MNPKPHAQTTTANATDTPCAAASPTNDAVSRHRLPELLAPAGGPEPFAAALAAGADAIYCGMGAFNARRKAANFTDEAFAQACRAAHLAGARVYVTVNIVIKDSELVDALELVRRCAVLGADAFIIQDWGLFAEVRRLMPELETHISTQANVHDSRGAAWCRDAGADRVTLSRELSIAEIAEIHRDVPSIELEVFAHGSICFSYSGVCLLSSFACAGRSANRGMCAQPCRLPYELVDETGRVLSPAGRGRPLCPRDTNTTALLPELIDAGAAALKLEGRMKAPDYVYAVTDAYRTALDELDEEGTGAGVALEHGSDGLSNRPGEAEAAPVPARGVGVEAAHEARARQLKRAFNRDFTCAYQLGTSGDEMMSYERSNNRGQEVGRTIGFTPRRAPSKGQAMRDAACGAKGLARIALTEPVGTGDLLELRHDDEPDQFLTGIVRADAAAGEAIELEVARPMPSGCRVRVIRSQRAIDAAKAALKRTVPRKRAVDVFVRARCGEAFRVELRCADDQTLVGAVEGFTVEPARTRPVSREDLVEHVGRMGTSPFEARSFTVELDDGCGMGFSAVHRVRAEACAALEAAILAPYEGTARALEVLPPFTEAALTAAHPLDVDARAEYPAVGAEGGAERVSAGIRTASGCSSTEGAPGHTPADASHAIDDARNATALICALANALDAAEAARAAGADRVYLPVDALIAAELSPADAAARGLIPVLDEVCRSADRDRLDPWVVTDAPVAVGTISSLALAAERGASAEVRSCIPVHNLACLRYLHARGASSFWLSPELTLDEIVRFAPFSPVPLGLMVYGRPRVMTSEHCVLQVADACIHDCARCGLRRRELFLHNIDGKLLPVQTDRHGRSRLYDATPLDLSPQLPQLLSAGITRFLVDGTLLDAASLAAQVAHARRALDAARAGRRPAPRQAGTHAGCLFVGVE